MTLKNLILIACTLLPAALFSGCESNEASPAGRAETFSGEYPIAIVCTTAQVGEMLRKVGGEHLQVTVLMTGDIDPHSYQATQQDVERMAEADMIFYSGLHLEGDLVGLFERMEKQKPTIAVTAELEQSGDPRLIQAEGDLYDPHVWFDALLWADCCRYVATELGRFDPTHAEEYQKNAEAYAEELKEVHEYCRSRIETIPSGQRVLVTAHDAFHYFGVAYGLEVRAIQGISTTQEASLKELNELVKFMVSQKIKAVFAETSVARDKVEALIEGCAAKGHTVVEGEPLYSDAMGRPGTPGGTYSGMIRHNVEAIVKALK